MTSGHRRTGPEMNDREIELNIDAITLAAMSPGGQRRLREAVERELLRLARHSSRHWAPRPGPERDRPARGRLDAGDDRAAESVAARIGRDVDAHLSGRSGQ